MGTQSLYNGIPFTGVLLRNSYEELVAPKAKVERLVHSNELIRLRRNLYVNANQETYNNYLAANYILAPSYVSGLSVLSYYDIIPETVVDTISMTTRKNVEFHNPLGTFTYRQCLPEYFFIGIETKDILNHNVLMAGIEKALCDHIVITPNLNLRYVRETQTWLEDEMRMDMDELSKMNLSIIAQCAESGIKKKMLTNIIKIFS